MIHAGGNIRVVFLHDYELQTHTVIKKAPNKKNNSYGLRPV
jgi:hypothetical protein